MMNKEIFYNKLILIKKENDKDIFLYKYMMYRPDKRCHILEHINSYYNATYFNIENKLFKEKAITGNNEIIKYCEERISVLEEEINILNKTNYSEEALNKKIEEITIQISNTRNNAKLQSDFSESRLKSIRQLLKAKKRIDKRKKSENKKFNENVSTSIYNKKEAILAYKNIIKICNNAIKKEAKV